MPTPSLDTAAIALHEVFSSYVRAGFTESQALQLVSAQLVATANNLASEGGE